MFSPYSNTSPSPKNGTEMSKHRLSSRIIIGDVMSFDSEGNNHVGGENWLEQIESQLVVRDFTQFFPFENLVKHCNYQLQKEKKLVDQLSSMNQEIRILKQNIDFEVTGVNPVLVKLQEELTESCRKSTEDKAIQKRLEIQVQELQDKVLALQTEMEKVKNQLEEKILSVLTLQQVIDHKEQALQWYKSELENVQAERNLIEEKYSTLEHQYQTLLDKWLQKQNELAEKLNEELREHADQKKKSIPDIVPTPIPDYILASSNTETRIDVSILPSRALKVMPGAHRGEVNACCYDFSGKSFATGGSDKVVKIWDSRTGMFQKSLTGSLQSIMDVDFSLDGQNVLGASNDNTTRVWSLNGSRLLHALTGHIGKVYAARFSADGQRVFTGSHDRTIKIWDLVKGYCLKTLLCYSSCNDLCTSMDGSYIISAHLDNTLRVWDTRSGTTMNDVPAIHSKQITSVCLNPDGYSVLTCSRDSTLKIVDLHTYEVLRTYRHDNFHPGVNWCRACYSPDGRYVGVGGANGSVFIWNTVTHKFEIELKGQHNSCVTAVTWHPNGHQVISVDRNGTIVLWE